MSWKLLILVSACLLGHVSSGQESQISENEVIMASSKAPEKNITGWFDILLSGTTTKSQPENEPPKSCPSCKCGISKSVGRILGGQETKIAEFPWMALLLDGDGDFLCAGSLINDYYILTTAQCIYGYSKEKITVRLLEHDLSNPNETITIDRKVSEKIRHRKYNSRTYDNDIALLKLDQRVVFRNTRKLQQIIATDEGNKGVEFSEIEDVRLSPVCLPSPELSYANYNAVVTGWGLYYWGNTASNVLQKVYVPILSNEDCRKTIYNVFTDNMLCAGYPEGGKDACEGDYGGPLHIKNNDTEQYQEVGIHSWHEGCGRPGIPGVYTRVNRYLDWIKDNTKDACYCQS